MAYFMEEAMKRNLGSEIDAIRNVATNFKSNVNPGTVNQLERFYFETEFENIINNDFMNINPDDLLDIYFEYFKDKKLPVITINKDQIFYRARIGYNIVPLAIDDLSKDFIIPYYDSDIGAPPPILATGGRFNREGTAYLYLSDDIETCLAEIHLQVGQKCSVSEFVCLNNIELLDLTKFDDDIEMQSWLKILTQPIHRDIVYKYNITRLLADVFKKINNIGIYFKSIQSQGNNIVCFAPELFNPIEYSSKIYTASQINYSFEVVKDSIDEYVEKDIREINSYNERVERELENKLEYFEDWVRHKKDNLK